VRWLGTDGMAENRGEHGGDGLPEADKALAWMRCNGRASFYSRALRGSNASYAKREEGRYRLGAAVERVCTNAAQRCISNGCRMEGTRLGHYLYTSVGVVSWTGGNPGLHTVHRGALAHRAYPATHTYAGSVTQGPRRCAFGRVSSASGTGCVRLRR
jgi:hypothetical protein